MTAPRPPTKILLHRDVSYHPTDAEFAALRAACPGIETLCLDLSDRPAVAEVMADRSFDILINNAGGPPPGDFRNWSRDDWIKAVDANMLTPIELMKAVIDGMCERGFGRIVNITSGAVKAPIDTLGLSNGARSGLTGFVAGLARQPKVASRNVTINGLLPGPFDTDRMQGMLANWAKRDGKSVAETASARLSKNPAQRMGNIDEFGATCAFLCSQHASFITGQNILMDGGQFPGTF